MEPKPRRIDDKRYDKSFITTAWGTVRLLHTNQSREASNLAFSCPEKASGENWWGGDDLVLAVTSTRLLPHPYDERQTLPLLGRHRGAAFLGSMRKDLEGMPRP